MEEYRNFKVFIQNKYHIDIDSHTELKELSMRSLDLILSLKIWVNYIKISENLFLGSKYYFEEILSNTIHSTILSIVDLTVPALMMMRRSQENILTFIYYSEHPIEYYKKEISEQNRNLSGFKELKDYITTYPFDSKFKINNQMTQKLCSDILQLWTQQYQELSNYVHGSNTKYFLKKEFLDELTYSKNDIDFLISHINKLSSVLNSLLIVFFFDLYIDFKEEEKSNIRYCIDNKYEFKNRIVTIFGEI